MSDSNVLTKEIAEQFVAGQSVRLSKFAAIEDAAAESLSKHEGNLELNGLQSLSDAAEAILSKRSGKTKLGGLTLTMSDDGVLTKEIAEQFVAGETDRNESKQQNHEYLPERLHRNRKPKGQRGGALGLGIVFTAAAAVGVVILLDTEPERAGLYYALTIGGGLLGLLLLWSWFVQKMTAEIPPAVVEISNFPLVSGTNAKICVRQPGPAAFKTLRANLICLRREKKKLVAGASQTGHSKTWVDRQIYDQNLIDVYQVQPSADDEWIEQADFYVPTDQPLSMMEKDLQIAWRIEVWGRVGYGMGVMHSFDVRVVAGDEKFG